MGDLLGIFFKVRISEKKMRRNNLWWSMGQLFVQDVHFVTIGSSFIKGWLITNGTRATLRPHADHG